MLPIILFFGLLILPLLQEGMFFDGVTYSAISKNMANGYGSFWNPHYTKVLYPSFHEHPPLVFIIQSFFFRLLGDSFYTERLFCLLIALLTVLGIVKCWGLVSDNTEMKSHYWLPILFWLLVPMVSWSYKNNLLENTMGVFSVFSVYFILRALIENKIVFIFWGGLFIVLAFLSKGFVGIFPLIVPLIFGMVFNQSKKSLSYFLFIIIFTVFTMFLLVKLSPEIVENITKYFEQQLFPALNNKREITTSNRFKIVFDLILDLSIILIFVFYFVFSEWKSKSKELFFGNKNFLFFILVAISASIPIIISLKQRKFYLIPSIPFYALAFSFLVYQSTKERLDRIPAGALKWFNRFSCAILGAILFFSTFRAGKYSRDEAILKDIYMISNYIPQGTVIGTTKELWSDWTLVAYLSRVGYISLDCDNEHEYLLIDKNRGDIAPTHYKPTDLNLINYRILKSEKLKVKN
jgi:4-amino-4-deoxy-L-arabinose transferase-like glycosyltransferase